jgi:hypothetical protein
MKTAAESIQNIFKLIKVNREQIIILFDISSSTSVQKSTRFVVIRERNGASFGGWIHSFSLYSKSTTKFTFIVSNPIGNFFLVVRRAPTPNTRNITIMHPFYLSMGKALR